MNQPLTPAHMSGQVSLSTFEMVVPPVTYQRLQEKIAALDQNSSRNCAVLKKWMAWAVRMPHHAVGPELGADFPAKREEFLAWCRSRSVNHGTLANRRSAINAIQTVYADAVAEATDLVDKTLWPTTLRRVFADAGLGICQALDRYGRFMGRWLYQGGLPCSRSAALLQRMEAELGCRPGELTRFIVDRYRYELIADFSGHVDPFKERHRVLRRKAFLIHLEEPRWAVVRRGWEDYVHHQTTSDPDLERAEGWTRNIRGEFPSAIRILSEVRQIFGYLTMPPSDDPDMSGLDLPVEAMTFAALGCWELMRRFVAFRHERSGGGMRYNGAIEHLVHTIVSLIRPDTGWLTQTEERWLPAVSRLLEVAGLSEDVTPGFFLRQYEAIAVWKSKRTKSGQLKTVRTRDPRVTLAPFLDVDNPLDRWIFPLIRRMTEDTPQDGGWKERFHAERALMLIVAFFSVPLRLINWQFCRVGPSQNLFRGDDGRFRLHITMEQFKNRRFLSDHYSIIVPDWAQPFFAHWIDEVLPQVPTDGRTRWLLCSLNGKPLTATNINDRFARVFKTYFKYPIRSTSARHIVATTYLKENPSNVQQVAIVLNDDLATVTHEYAHLLSQDHFRFFGEFASGVAEAHFGPTLLPPYGARRLLR